MKKYYINIRNSKKGKMIDLIPLAIFSVYIGFFVWMIFAFPWIVAIPCAFVVGMLGYYLIPFYVYCFANRIYVDDEKDAIILKRFRRKDQVIKFSSISRLETAKNKDPSLGVISKGGGIYCVKDSEGYIRFYCPGDRVTLSVFEARGIPVINLPQEYI